MNIESVVSWCLRYLTIPLSFFLFLGSIVMAGYLGYEWYKVNRLDPTRNNLWLISEKVNYKDQSIRVVYPARLLYDAPASEIRITQHANSAPTTPLTITLYVDRGLVISNTHSMPGLGQDLIFSSVKQRTQTKLVYVANAHTITQAGFLSQSIRIKALGFTQTLTLPIEVEGAEGAIWRAFVNSAINEKSPLLLALSAITSLIVFGYNFIQQQRIEKSKRAEDAKKLFKETIRQALIDAKPATARDELNKFLTEGLKDYVHTDEVEYVKKLIETAEGNTDNLQDIIQDLRWPDETLGMLIALTNKLPGVNRKTLENAVNIFLTLPGLISDEKQQMLRDTLTNWNDKLKRPTCPSWKPDRPKPQPFSQFASELCRTLQYSPFEYENAEDDTNFLFGETGGFWSTDNTLYNRIVQNDIPEVIFGPEGCGKTALARALVELDHPGPTKVLPLYIPGEPDPGKTQQCITESLLNFICANPFELTGLGSYEQDLLARQLCIGLSHDIVRASIQRAKDRLPFKAEGNEQQDLWKKENIFQLNVFEKLLDKNKIASWARESDWLKLTHQSIISLGFKFIRVSLDLNTNNSAYAREILALLRPWADHGLIIKVFLPQSIGQKLIKGSTYLNFLQLSWKDSEIEALAKWRFGVAIYLSVEKKHYRDLEDIFDGNLLSRFIEQAQRNPRRLIRLWRFLLDDHLDSSPELWAFSNENFERAVGKLK